MIRLSIRRPIATSMVYLSVAMLGITAAFDTPIELLPDTTLPRLVVTATWPGASPETTEARLTSPLESAIQQVRGVARITSESFEVNGLGQARIVVEFTRGTEMDFARLELSERLAAIDGTLPPGSFKPQVTGYVPREFRDHARPFLEYTVTGPYTLESLRAHVEDVIFPELARIDGVANLAVSGGRARVIEVELDEDRIRALRLAPGFVRQRLAQLDLVRHVGVVERRGLRRPLVVHHRTSSVEEIRTLPLLPRAGRIVRVGDVARVHDTFEDPQSYYRVDGRPAISFAVHRASGSNAIAVADRVRTSLSTLEDAHPPGIRLILDHDESDAIRAQFADLRSRALFSAGIVFLVLLLSLRSTRATAIVFAAIAFSILITLNLIYFGGYTLNVLTLLGLAMGFGLVVDNSIVVLENIYRLRARGLPAAAAAELGAREVFLAILASTLTTVVVLVPFVYLQGELRDYYVPLAIVVGFSLLASLFVAFTFIPAAAKVADRPSATNVPADHSRARITSTYTSLVEVTLRFPRTTIVLALLALCSSYYLFDRHVTRDILWGALDKSDTYLSIQLRLPRGADIDHVDELATAFERRLSTITEVERFITRVSPQFAEIRVTFPDSLDRTAIPVAVKEQLIALGNSFGGAEVRVYGFGPSFYVAGGSAPSYSIRILGYDYQTVGAIADDLAARLRRFPRVHGVDHNAATNWFDPDRATEFVLDIDRHRLARHGLTARDLVAYLSAAVPGEDGGEGVRIGGDEARITVKIAGSRDLDLMGFRGLSIPTPSGHAARLADLATVTERDVPGVIVRENQQYRRLVTYEFHGPAKLGDRIHESVMKSTLLPPGYSLEGRQEWRWADDEKVQIRAVLAFAIILVFMVTAALFESIRLPLCILITVPMALIGVFITFYLVGATFTREAYIGVIMMCGIVVNNSILLVDHINQLRRIEGLALESAIVRGALDRARPVLMTSATTILGLIPLVVLSESADSNIWNALGYALIGGLTTSTILVLTVTPALYLLFERR